MIELRYYGICEQCCHADLYLTCEELRSGFNTINHWTARCKHQEACERMYAKMRREAEQNETDH